MDYKEILKGIVNIINTAEKSDIGFANICTYIGENCPELCESENERIRKEILQSIRDNMVVIHKDECIAWLEKQGNIDEDLIAKKFLINKGYPIDANGTFPTYEELYNIIREGLENQSEQKLTDEPKFKVGNWVVDNHGEVNQVTSVTDDGYAFALYDGTYVSGCWKENYHLWTIADAKDGDVLVFKNNIGGIIICKSPSDYDTRSYCRLIRDNLINKEESGWDSTLLVPATKEQRDLLFQKMKEEGYEWDAEKKELKKIEFSDVGHEYYSELLKNDKSDNIADYAYQCAYCMSHDWIEENATWDDVQKACRLGAEWNKRHHKSAWSDEDKKMIGRIRSIVEKYAFSQSAVDVNGDLWEKEYIDADNWLKSLKESVKSQNMWKVVDKGIYVKEPALAQKKDKSEPGHGFVVCYDHTLTPDVYERYIMLSDINCHSWWKPSDEQMNAFKQVYDWYNTHFAQSLSLNSLYYDLKKLKGE